MTNRIRRPSSRPKGYLTITETAEKLDIPKPTLYGVMMVPPSIIPTREVLPPGSGRRRAASLLSPEQQAEIRRRVPRR